MIQVFGKSLPVPLAEGGWSTRFNPTRPEGIHEISHGQLGLNRTGGMHLTTGVEGVPSLANHLGGQRNVSRNH